MPRRAGPPEARCAAKVSVPLPPEIHARVQRAADAQRITLAAWIRQALLDKLQQEIRA